MKSCIHLSYLLIAMFAYGVCGDKGICAISPSTSTSPLTPVALLKALKEGTGTRTQLKIALFRYMSQEAEKANDQVTWYTPEAGRNTRISSNTSVLRRIGPSSTDGPLSFSRLFSRSWKIRILLYGLTALTGSRSSCWHLKSLLRRRKNKSGRWGFWSANFIFPKPLFQGIQKHALSFGTHAADRFFHASSFFDMGKEFYPLGIEAYKHLLKTHATHPSSQSHYVYWISWGYLQLKQYDEAIAWARKMPPCIGMTDAPARLEKWARQAKARQKKRSDKLFPSWLL